MQFKLSGYYEPTPEKIRKIGDVLQYGAQIAAGASIVNEKPEIGLIVVDPENQEVDWIRYEIKREEPKFI